MTASERNIYSVAPHGATPSKKREMVHATFLYFPQTIACGGSTLPSYFAYPGHQNLLSDFCVACSCYAASLRTVAFANIVGRVPPIYASGATKPTLACPWGGAGIATFGTCSGAHGARCCRLSIVRSLVSFSRSTVCNRIAANWRLTTRPAASGRTGDVDFCTGHH